jgi:hypothetical protein
MGSLYSLLEPCSLAIPGASLAQWPDQAAVLMVDAPGIDGIRPVAHGREDYEDLVRRLVDSEDARRDLGDRLRDSIAGAHAGAAWQAAFEAVVDRAPVAREVALEASAAMDGALDAPATDLLAQGLAWIPEAVAPPPERITMHLPLAGG